MEEQIIDDEQAKHFIGNLLHDDDSFTTRNRGVSNVSSENHSNVTSNATDYQSCWQDDSNLKSSPTTTNWNNSPNLYTYDFFFKSNPQTTYNQHDYFPTNRYLYGSNWQTQKPMATVPPFQTNENNQNLSPNNTNHSPTSESIKSDSGTISPEPKTKTKWKKLDLTIDIQEPPINVAAQKSNSDKSQKQQPLSKTYSSVAQQSKNETSTTSHKRVSNSNSVPLSRTSISKKSSTGKTTNTNKNDSNSQPITPENVKSSKIFGLNPLPTNPVATPIIRPIPPAVVLNTNQSDFQKIKRKKGKTSTSKVNIKNDSGHKPSRFMALAQQPLPKEEIVDDITFDDDDEDSEYLIQIEVQKEAMRAKAREELAACNSTDAEKAAKMQKLENEMRIMFATKRRQVKTKNGLNRQRNKRNGYRIIFPEYIKAFIRLLSRGFYCIFLFMFNLISDVAERSVIALITFAKSSKEMFIELNTYLINTMKFLLSRIATEIYEHLRYAAIDEPIIYQIGLLENCELPTCCEDVIERLYKVINADAYSVLGLNKDCLDEDIMKYYTAMKEYLKPELYSNVGLSESLLLIETAYNLISTPIKRKEYDLKLEQLPQTYELQRDLDDLRSLINLKATVLHCECGDIHPIFRAQNHPGRYCLKDGKYHSPKNGDIWVEKRCFGMLRVIFAAINGAIYDISKWNDCAANRIPLNKTDLHNPAYRFYLHVGSNACLVNNERNKHRCSTMKNDGTECVLFAKDTPIPIESLCCCNLVVCSIPENVILQNIPCCFGANLIPCHTATASSSGEKQDDRARRAGRRRLVRR